MPLVQLEHVTKIYDTADAPVLALDDLTLTVCPGDFFSVTGASGSGKSTLMNLLACLDFPTSGTLTLDGYDVTAISPSRLSSLRAARLGLVFQSFHLLPALTALQNVELPLLYRHIPPAARRSRALAALDAVDLSARASHLPSQLSGGQQQRVAIARTLAASPTLLLADEPTGALDPALASDILSLLLPFARPPRALVLITHDPALASLAPTRLRLERGRLV